MKKGIRIGIAILVLALIGRNFIPEGKPEVKVEKVQMGELSNSSLYPGTVIPEEITPIYIKSPAIIERIIANKGDEVGIGSPLMAFSNKSLLENQKLIEINKFDIENTKLKLSNLETGTTDLELNNRLLEIKALEEKIKKNSKNLPILAREAKVYKELLEKDGISSLEYNKKLAEFEGMKTTIDLDNQKYSLLKTSYEVLKSELEISKQNLKLALTKLEFVREDLLEGEKELLEPLKSPVEGVILEIPVTEGSQISKGQMLAAIALNKNNKVMIELPLYQQELIGIGQDAKVIAREYSNKKEYKAVVNKVSSVAKEARKGKEKVIEVELLLTEANDLKLGFLVDAIISGKTKKDVLLVDNFSILEENGKHYVFVIEEGRAVKREIKVGAKTINNYEVLDLPVGTEIIVNPFKVKDGEKVKVVD